MFKQCQQCGRLFEPAATTPYQKFCSARCGSRYRYQARPPKPKKTKQCQWCGKPFATNSFHAKYCPDCRETANKEHHKEICRRYYAAHREQLREKQNRYRSQHREEFNAQTRKRYRRKCIEFWKQQEATP